MPDSIQCSSSPLPLHITHMIDDTIRRLITNQKAEHTPHAFAGNCGGMDDFKTLYPVLTQLPVSQLRKWMRVVDQMRATHSGCGSCYAKILACSILFTERAPALCQRYRELFKPFESPGYFGRNKRDIMAEVVAAIQGMEVENEGDLRSDPVQALTDLIKMNIDEDADDLI